MLWKFAAEAQIHHFGTSAPFLVACMKESLTLSKSFDLSALRSIGSTGSPLPAEAFDWVYEHVKRDIWLCSMAGGTDVCTAWVGGNPLLCVRAGEIQARCLGAALFSFDENGKSVVDEVGEMVVTKPMPSMPIFFWNDPDGKKYSSSYFENFQGVWRHGDWVKTTADGAVIISGRSDATLNRGGVRIGTAEIYRTVEKVPEIQDSLIVNLELPGGKDFMPLFVVLKNGLLLNDMLKTTINKLLRNEYSPRHVPDAIIEIPEVPYTISGKKMESPVKKLLMGVPIEKAVAKGSMKNPDSLTFFLNFNLPPTN
jgi:acetoacetyl-CoA synthetase